MEKLLELFLTTDIENSKLIRAFSIFSNIILADWLYKKLFGAYVLIDFMNPHEIVYFFLSGQVLIVIICYALIALSGYLFTMAGITWYSFYHYPQKERLIRSVKEEEKELSEVYKKASGLLTVLVIIFCSMGIARRVSNNKLLISDDNVIESLKGYFEQPKYLVFNVIRFIKTVFVFSLAFIIISNTLSIPITVSILIYFGLFIFTTLLVLLTLPLTTIEVLAPDIEEALIFKEEIYSLD